MERGRGKGGNICPSWTDLLAPLLAGMLPGGFLFLGKLCGRTDLHGGRMQGQLARVCEGGAASIHTGAVGEEEEEEEAIIMRVP